MTTKADDTPDGPSFGAAGLTLEFLSNRSSRSPAPDVELSFTAPALGDADLRVSAADVREALNELYEIEVELNTPDASLDLDLLIGVPELLGQGIGSRALALAIGEITSTLRPPFFSLCTETANLRALRCYQKSGFNIARQFLESGKWHYFLTRPATP